jgi:alkanesulfonate monooxygenase SsuD/methylene tetrahydromethanopterin reductase-like flavin-dependent oxidoreductase (luciferase family)
VQKPYPPITIGGGGEKLTLRVTARHADKLDWGYLPSLESYRRKLKVLEKHCASVGRSFNEIEKSCWPAGQLFIGNDRKILKKKVQLSLPKGVILEDFLRTSFVGTPEDCIKQLRQYVNLGVTRFMLFFGDLPDLTGLRLFAENIIRKIEVINFGA